jgi:hypothetical protein
MAITGRNLLKTLSYGDLQDWSLTNKENFAQVKQLMADLTARAARFQGRHRMFQKPFSFFVSSYLFAFLYTKMK